MDDKLGEDDEGALQIAISSEKGCVRIDFGKYLDGFAFPPDLALQLAAAIAKHAIALKRKA
jgi:hypothetical protein